MVADRRAGLTSPCATTMAEPRANRPPLESLVSSRPGRTLRLPPILWVILVAMLARVTVFSYKRPTSEFASVNLSATVAIVLTLLSLVLVVAAPAAPRFLGGLKRASFRFLFGYYAVCVVSFVWSLLPRFSAYRGLEALSQILVAALALYYTRNFERSERALLRFSALAAGLALFGVAKRHLAALTLDGLHNTLYPLISAAALAYCFGEYLGACGPRRTSLRRWGFLFGPLILLGTSSGAMVASVAGLSVAGLAQKVDKRVPIAFMLVGALLLLSTGSLTDFAQKVMFPGKSEQQIENLSGRKRMFVVYVEAILDQPVLGYGFGTLARVGSRFGSQDVRSAHNGYFEVALGTGAVGGAFFLAWLFLLGREMRAALRHRPPGAVGSIAAMTALAVNNLTTPAFGGPWFGSLTIVALFLAHFALWVQPGVVRSGRLQGDRSAVTPDQSR